MKNSDVIVRFDDRLISLNTLKSLIPAYWFFKILDKFERSPKKEVTCKMYNGSTITLIYR